MSISKNSQRPNLNDSPISSSSQDANEIQNNVNGRQPRNISSFSSFKRFFSEAFSAVYSAIIKVFSNPAQAQAATMHISSPRNAGDRNYPRDNEVTPNSQYVAKSISTEEKSPQEIQKDKMKSGEVEFKNILNLREKTSTTSHINISPDARYYAQQVYDNYEKYMKEDSAYQIGDAQREEINFIIDILNINVKKLLPQQEEIFPGEQSKPIIEVTNKPQPHKGEQAFLRFFKEWEENNEEWAKLKKINQAGIIIDSCNNEDCIGYAQFFVNPTNSESLINGDLRLKKLSAANYLLSQNKKIEEKKQSELKKEARRAEKKEINSAIENKIAPVYENKIGELAGKKNNPYHQKPEILFYDSFDLIPKGDRAVLANKLNYSGSKLDMGKVSSGLKFLKEYKPESEVQSDFSADDISSLHEIFTFINLLNKAYVDPNGNPIKAHGFGGGRIFKDDLTEGILEKIHTNRDEISRLIGEIFRRNNVAETGNAVTSSALPISSPPIEKSPVALIDTVANAPSEKPFPPATPPLPPSLPPGGVGLPLIPVFPALSPTNVDQIFDFLYGNADDSQRTIFKKAIFNRTAAYFSDEEMKSNEIYRVAADSFALLWKRADKSKILVDLAVASIVNFYVEKHIEENPDLREFI